MPHRHPCLSTKRPTVKTINRMTAVSPLSPHCWHFPSLGGSADFTLARRTLPPSRVALAPYPETREWRRRRRTPRLCQITAVSPLSLHFWHLPSLGGIGNVFSDSRPPPPSTVSPAPYPETRGRSRSRRTPRPYRLLIFSLVRWRQ